MVICGIDYSLTSPSITIHSGKEWNLYNCSCHYMTQNTKSLVKTPLFRGYSYPEFFSQEERHFLLTTWALHVIVENRVDKCFIESYSFGSKGLVFNIAENTGLLKHYLWKNSIEFELFAPSAIKKFATGKGNANKKKMFLSFYKETGINLPKKLNQTEKQENPSSDIIDSYYIAKLGHSNHLT